MKFFLAGLTLLLAAGISAQSEEMVARADATLFEHGDGELASGAGAFLYVGRTGQGSGQALRRALLRFDISDIPEGAVITSAELLVTSNLNGPNAEGTTLTVHEVLSHWSEGGSDAGDPGGMGTNAAENDATWIHRSYDSDRWDNEGGDFAEGQLASAEFEALESMSFADEALRNLVQQWVDGEVENRGIMLRGDEEVSRGAIRLASRSSGNTTDRPVLVIEFE